MQEQRIVPLLPVLSSKRPEGTSRTRVRTSFSNSSSITAARAVLESTLHYAVPDGWCKRARG